MANTPDYIKYAASVVPSERQIKWQETEFYAFIHYGINTYTDSEWGNGNEDPELFNPESLDCRQWAKLCKLAGMKGLILTAKHHDGFCLWPSAYTDFSVRSSNWKDGKGDVVAECAEACREFGLKFGIYVSLGQTRGNLRYRRCVQQILQESASRSPYRLRRAFLRMV